MYFWYRNIENVWVINNIYENWVINEVILWCYKYIKWFVELKRLEEI